MSDGIVKRQHFVPRTYLKHFSRKEGEEYFINVLPSEETDENKIFETNIKNVALQKHLYTLPGNTADEKMLLEKFYSENYESQYDRIHSLLLDSRKTTISDEERELIISTVVTMLYRTTYSLTKHNDLIRRVYTKMYEMCKIAGTDFFDFEGTKISIKDKNLEELIKEYSESSRPMNVLKQLELALKLINLRIENDGISVLKLNCEAEFLTSDNPVIAFNPFSARTAQFDPMNILKLPLDKKHVLYIMPDNMGIGRNTIHRRELENDICLMEKLVTNFDLMKSSERFIFGSKTALKTYLKTKELSEKQLTDEEFDSIKSMDSLLKKCKELGIT